MAEEQKTRKKILIVNHNKETLNFLSYKFGRIYDTRTAENGLECMEELYKYRPDIILLDFQLPIMNGYDALKKIKNDWDVGIRNTPVIIITGYGSVRNAVEFMKAGAENYFEKPLDMEERIKSVMEVVERKE